MSPITQPLAQGLITSINSFDKKWGLGPHFFEFQILGLEDIPWRNHHIGRDGWQVRKQLRVVFHDIEHMLGFNVFIDIKS